jgi:DeoR family transcriptional regulator of aga operon
MKPYKNNFSSNGNITLDRRAKILEILEDIGQVKIFDLGKLFNVSEVTVRNDLDKLEEKGLLIRTRGGGIRTQRVRIDYQLNKESTHHLKEKQLIGKKAIELIKEKDTILLDSGTTTLQIASNLAQMKDLTIITNALNIASQFVDNENIKVVMSGGDLRHSSLSFIGPIAVNSIKNLYCDKVFLGVNGIDSKYGISTTNSEDAYLNNLMMDISKEVIVVTDSSKFLKRSFSKIAPINKIDIVVTDSNVPEEEVRNLQNSGVRVIIA